MNKIKENILYDYFSVDCRVKKIDKCSINENFNRSNSVIIAMKTYSNLKLQVDGVTRNSADSKSAVLGAVPGLPA